MQKYAKICNIYIYMKYAVICKKNALICKICYICYERLLHLLLSRTEPKSESLPLVSS